MKQIKTILLIQGFYLTLTAVWPLVSMQSFLQVTGPKYDLWLVNTVSLLLLPVGLLLLVKAICFTGVWDSLFIVGLLNAAALAIADFYFGLKGIVSPVYLVDGLCQLGFVLAWSIAIFKYHIHLLYFAGSWKN